MRRLLYAVSATCLVFGTGCNKPAAPLKQPIGSLPASPVKPPAAQAAPEVIAAGYTRDPQDPFVSEAYVEPQFTPAVPDYKLEPGLKNVVNFSRYVKLFDADQLKMLAENYFIVLPANMHQIEFIYEGNSYMMEKSNVQFEMPSFVTVDSVLHPFHVFFDYALKTIEEEHLEQAAASMTAKLLSGALEDLQKTDTAEMKQAALKNIEYLLVPAKALGVKTNGMAIPATPSGVNHSFDNQK